MLIPAAISSSVAIIIGAVVSIGGMVGGAIAFVLKYKRTDEGEHVKQQSQVLADAMGVYEKLQTTLTLTEAQLTAAKAERDAAKVERDAAKAERDEATSERERMRLQVECLTAEVSSLTAKVDTLQMTLEQVRDR